MSLDCAAATVIDLRDLDGAWAGGKAEGLARLIRLGLPVPRGFVVVGARSGQPTAPAVVEAYRALGPGPVAVRSSALGEDGVEASFAGQFETVLGVESEEALAEAIERCLRSLEGERAATYGARSAQRPTAMAVVVQRMVAARAAGVIFTVDAARGRSDRMVVEGVAGLGDALVAGHVDPERYELSRRDLAVRSASQGELLSPEELAQLARQALEAERCFGRPLDLEWAIDVEGRIAWLQARPITTPTPDLNELDELQGEEDVYTLFNVGEMIPGAVAPLSLSTAARGIDYAIQSMIVMAGARPRVEPRLQTVGVTYGRLFLNLSPLFEFADRTAGVTRESTVRTLCGRGVPELCHEHPAPRWVRALNAWGYLRWTLGGSFDLRRFQRRLRRFELSGKSTAADTYREVDAKLQMLMETYRTHIRSSAGAGFAAALLVGVIGRGGPLSPEQEALIARHLAGAGAESADLVVELEALITLVASEPEAEARFVRATPAAALAWLQGAASAPVRTAYARFLDRHGHRGFRELAIESLAWVDDPLPLISSMQPMLLARLAGRARPPRPEAPESAGRMLSWLLRTTQAGVQRREHTKSMLVAMTHRFKRVYRHLGMQLAEEGLLAEAELVFYLTHEELGELALGRAPALGLRAERRRRAHRVQSLLDFEEVCFGRPLPRELRTAGDLEAGELAGQPVSPGVVEGIARVVRTIDEAASLRPGEILITPLTDVAWTPYYSVIGGLATDLGSPFSHGAVVAREYGLPAVANLRTATRTFETGDRVVLDGDRGVLRRLERAQTSRTPRASARTCDELKEEAIPC